MPQNIKKLKPEDVDFIKNNYKTMSVKELAVYFHISNKCMRGKIERLGINLSELNRTKRVEWDDEDINFLIKNYPTMAYDDIATYLGKEKGYSKSIVYRKLKSLNLKKKREILNAKIKIDEYGYKYTTKGTKKFYTHRIKIEKLLGRKLNSNEIVHHIDCDKSNDDINNLLVCNSSEHKLLHYQLENIARELTQNGLIKFDKKTKKYLLILPTRTKG